MAKKTRKRIENRTFTDVGARDIYFRNFSGINRNKPGQKIKPKFGIKLTEELAKTMTEEGWYIRWTKVREDAPEGTQPIPYLEVTLKYDFKPAPTVNMIFGKHDVTPLTEESIAPLDGVSIDHMDFEVRAFDWDDSGRYGAAAELIGLNVYCKRSLIEERLAKFMEEDTIQDPDD